MEFSRDAQKDFSMGAKTSKISFYPLKTKKTTFFAETLIGKCQMGVGKDAGGKRKSRGTLFPCVLSDAHLLTIK